MASKKKKEPKAARIHVRAPSFEEAAEYHAYAARCGTTLSKLVISYLQESLKVEAATNKWKRVAAKAARIIDAEQI